MKKSICILFVLTLVTSAFAKGFPEKEKRDVPSFSEVEIAVSSDVILVQGDQQEVILEGDPDILENIETNVSGNKLTIKHKNRSFKSFNSKIKIHLTMNEINGVSISGSAKVIAEKTINTSDIYMSISGSGNLKFSDLNASNIKMSISGSGDVYLEGPSVVDEISLKISGSGNFNGENIQTKNASISVSGSGNCRTKVSDKLRAKVSGSGDIIYFGQPLVDISSSGSGKVRNGNM